MNNVIPLVTREGDRIAIVDGLRTPFAKQATAYHGTPAVDLGKMVVSELLAKQHSPLGTGEVDALFEFGLLCSA